MKKPSYLFELRNFMSNELGDLNNDIEISDVWEKLNSLIREEVTNVPGYERHKIISTNESEFGKLMVYKKDDVVVWRGDTSCIGVIKEDFDCTNKTKYNETLVNIAAFSNSCHYSNIRLATEDEKKLLCEKGVRRGFSDVKIYMLK